MEKGAARFIVPASFLELLCCKAGTTKIVLKEIIRNCTSELIVLPYC
jgi:hypothetical protein